MPPQHDRQTFHLFNIVEIVDCMAQVGNALWYAVYTLAFAFVVARCIIGKYVITVARKIVGNVHITVLSSSAYSVRKDDYTLCFTFFCIIPVADKLLAGI